MTRAEACDVLAEILSVLRDKLGRGVEESNFERYDKALEIAARALSPKWPPRRVGRKP